MRIVKSVTAMQAIARRWRREGARVGFVPTMGWLHAGHLSLARRARKLAGPRGKVVVSIYVNPTQFGPREDFSRYPRDLARDARLCRGQGVDVIFAPGEGEMYPATETGGYSTFVAEEKLSQRMEGASRPTHFRGVTTVVAKLFNIVQPDVAVFGAKDYQQAAVIQRMVRDLNFPLRIVVAPTHREPDGLAMSSRNQYLTGDERGRAPAIYRELRRAAERITAGEGDLSCVEQAATAALTNSGMRVDYFVVRTRELTAPAAQDRELVILAAARLGRARLIDNLQLTR